MEKEDGGNQKKEIFHVGQIEKQNDKMKNGEKFRNKKREWRGPGQFVIDSLILQNTWTCITFLHSETFTKERVCVTVLTV